MSKFKIGDRVKITNFFGNKMGIVIEVFTGSCTMYKIKYDNGFTGVEFEYNLSIIELAPQKSIIEKVLNKNMKNNEEKELKKDVEILLNIYLSNRDMNKKEIKRFSERHFDIIEKQNAKNTLKRRGN